MTSDHLSPGASLSRPLWRQPLQLPYQSGNFALSQSSIQASTASPLDPNWADAHPVLGVKEGGLTLTWTAD